MNKRQRVPYGYRTIGSGFVETKYYDTVVPSGLAGDVATNAAMIVSPAVGIPQGVEDNARIGNKLAIKSVHTYGTITLADGNALSYNGLNANDILRYMVIIDTQTNGVSLNLADVLDYSIPGSFAINAFRTLNRSSRFRVVKDEFLTLSSNGYTTDGTSYYTTAKQQQIEFHHKFKNPLILEYSGALGGIAEMRTNNVYIVMLSKNNKMYFDGNTRVRYTD